MHDQFRDGGIVLENALTFWVNRYYQASRREMYRCFAEQGFDLTPEHFMVLVRLWERDAWSQADLCESTTRDPSTMSRIIDAMVKRGLVRRALDPADGRSRIIVLTEAGRAAEAALVPVVQQIVARIEAEIPTRDLEITRKTLRHMTANLG